MQTVADVSTCPSILYDETDPEPPRSRSKAGQHLFETGEAHVLQAYPLRIVSLWKGGGNCSCNLPVSEQSLPWLLFQGFGCFCTEENMLLFILSISHNNCYIIILRKLGKIVERGKNR